MANKPLCGNAGSATGDTILSRISGWLGLISTIGGIVSGVSQAIAATSIITILGVSATAGMWLAAVAGAVVGLVIIIASVVDRLSDRKGLRGCYAGVVTSITPSFSDFASNIAPYTAQHDRVDVVVKPTYWSLVERGLFVYCDTDSLESPLIRGYDHSTEIVGAATGSIVGGVAGAVAGILLGALAAAAIGCATIILCIIALIVAALIALVAVLILAFAGGQIGRAAGSSSPTGTPSGGGASAQIASGDYVTINGNMVLYPEDSNAIVAWWIGNTTVHGRSASGEGTGGSAPFRFTDPRDNLEPDDCRIITDSEP